MQNKTSKKYLLAPFLPFPENQEGWFSINVFLKGRWSHGGGGNFSFYWRASSFRGVAPGALNVVHGSSGCEHVWERLYWPCLETQSNYNARWNEPKANRTTSYKRRGLLFFFSPSDLKKNPHGGASPSAGPFALPLWADAVPGHGALSQLSGTVRPFNLRGLYPKRERILFLKRTVKRSQPVPVSHGGRQSKRSEGQRGPRRRVRIGAWVSRARHRLRDMRRFPMSLAMTIAVANTHLWTLSIPSFDAIFKFSRGPVYLLSPLSQVPSMWRSFCPVFS